MPNRRILLVLVLVLFVCDLGVLGWVRNNRDMLDRSTVKIYIEKPDVAESVKAKLEASGRTTKVEQNITKARPAHIGWKVFLANKDAELLKPVLDTLKHDKIPAKLTDGEIIVFGNFPTEKKAKEALPKVAKYGFQTAENFKVMDQKVTCVMVDVEGKSAVDAIRSELSEFKPIRPDDISVTATTP